MGIFSNDSIIMCTSLKSVMNIGTNYLVGKIEIGLSWIAEEVEETPLEFDRPKSQDDYFRTSR